MQAVIDALRGQDDFLIYTHIAPDGDALGSAFALKYALQSIGKRAQVVLGEEIPEAYSFFGTDYRVCVQPEARQAVVAVDCGDRARVAGLEAGQPVDIGIDHHKAREDFAAAFCVDDQAAATAELLFELFSQMGIALSPEIAQCLYVGIATDTGGFRYANTTGKTHRYAATLMETGIEAHHINQLLFENQSLQSLRAKSVCIRNLELYCTGRLAVSFISGENRAEYGFTSQDIDGLSSIPRSVRGVEAGVLLWQRSDGRVQVSLRSHGAVDVSRVAKAHGGGGHKNASGFTAAGPLSSLKEELIAEIGALL